MSTLDAPNYNDSEASAVDARHLPPSQAELIQALGHAYACLGECEHWRREWQARYEVAARRVTECQAALAPPEASPKRSTP